MLGCWSSHFILDAELKLILRICVCVCLFVWDSLQSIFSPAGVCMRDYLQHRVLWQDRLPHYDPVTDTETWSNNNKISHRLYYCLCLCMCHCLYLLWNHKWLRGMIIFQYNSAQFCIICITFKFRVPPLYPQIRKGGFIHENLAEQVWVCLLSRLRPALCGQNKA